MQYASVGKGICRCRRRCASFGKRGICRCRRRYASADWRGMYAVANDNMPLLVEEVYMPLPPAYVSQGSEGYDL